MRAALLALKALPSLLTDCVLVGHARKADVVFTLREWFALGVHMRNDNAANFFLMPYRDKNGQPRYAKALRADAEKRMQWAWDTITGKATSPASVGFYPTNAERETRWGGMDFDAHDGDFTRAHDFALKAFTLLYQQPQLFVCLATSAGDAERSGFHLFVFSREFYPCEEWTRLFKQVAAQIGARIQDGICEIFPNESRGLPKPLRAPGTWNPKTGDCGLILHESLTQSFLPSLPYGRERDGIALSVLCEPRGKKCLVHRVGEVFRGEHGEWKRKFGITALGTRHDKLTKLVGTAFFQAGREVVRENAELQYREATPAPNASLQEHLAEFDKAWAGMERQWLLQLSTAERRKYKELTIQTDRDAFRIIRNWSKKDPSMSLKSEHKVWVIVLAFPSAGPPSSACAFACQTSFSKPSPASRINIVLGSAGPPRTSHSIRRPPELWQKPPYRAMPLPPSKMGQKQYLFDFLEANL